MSAAGKDATDNGRRQFLIGIGVVAGGTIENPRGARPDEQHGDTGRQDDTVSGTRRVDDLVHDAVEAPSQRDVEEPSMTADNRKRGEQPEGRRQREAALVRIPRPLPARLAEERDAPKAQHVKRGEGRGKREHAEDGGILRPGEIEDRILGEEAGERRDAAQRQAADQHRVAVGRRLGDDLRREAGPVARPVEPTRAMS